MINIKKIIYIILLTFLFVGDSNALIKDSLFATVGDQAITQSDITNEIKVILILNNQSYSDKKRQQLQNMAIQALIKRNIKKIETAKYVLQYNKDDLNIEFERIATNINMDTETLKNTLTANGIDYTYIIDHIRTELLWNSLIFDLYKDRLSINLDEIDEQLKLIETKKETEEFLISEIIIKPVRSDLLNSEIEKIKKRIEDEGFAQVAMDISLAETALAGGNLGWISENIISEDFRLKIKKTPVGSISDPILYPEGIIIFKVRDKRKIEKNISLEDAKDQLVKAEKSKILNMHSLSHYDNLKRTISINFY